MTKVHPCCSVCGHPRADDRRLVSSFHAYICEHCLANVAASPAIPDGVRGSCFFCETPNLVLTSAWPNFPICHDCLSLAHRVIADDNRLIAQAT
jgi:hypothetical protein